MLNLETPEIQEYAASIGLTPEIVEKVALDVRQFRTDLGDVAGFSARELEAMYQRGMQMLQDGHAEHAGRVFFSLVQLKSREARYYRAVGLAFHHMREWGWARHFYHIALYLLPDDPISSALMGECQLYMVGKRAAAAWLDKALALPNPKPEAEPFLNRARAVRAKIVL